MPASNRHPGPRGQARKRPRKSARKSATKSARQDSDSARFGWLWRLLGRLFLIGLLVLAGYLVYLDSQVRGQFEGRQWALPAHVFARPMELYPGQEMTLSQVVGELRQLGYRKVSGSLQSNTNDQRGTSGIYRQGRDYVDIATRGFEFWDGKETRRQVRLRFQGGAVKSVTTLGKGPDSALLRLEPLRIGGIYPSRGEDRLLVRLKEVPKALTDALVAVEDRHFYTHMGVSPKAIARAMWVNFQAGKVRQGGSTLTQQLVKNLFLTRERSLERKLKEVLMSFLLELHYSKEEILETYLNEVYLGQDGARAIHGFGLAAEFYFGRPLNELRVDQLALLVGMVKGPSYYNPRRNAERAKERRDVVLSVMGREGVIGEGEAETYQASKLGLISSNSRKTARFPAFMDLVKRQLKRDYREEDLLTEGLRVFTTLDPTLQGIAQDKLSKRSDYLQKRHKPKGELQGAVVLAEAASGEVVALVGDRFPKREGFNRALDAVRPIGSLVKVATYLSALEEGKRYSLVSTLDDSELVLKTGNGKVWRPKNSHGEYHGDVLLMDALAHSYNPASVRLGLDLGLDRVHATLKRLGVLRDPPKVPAMLLGAFNLPPLEVTQMMQTVAASGFRTPLRAIREVMNPHGQPLARYPLRVEQVFNPQTMYLMQRALHEVTLTGTARYLSQMLPPDRAVAGKTGTTDDLRDAWYAGFDSRYVGVVWLGLDNNASARLTGTSGAMLVWGDIWRAMGVHALADFEPEHIPAGVDYALIQRDSGRLGDTHCPHSLWLPFQAGQTPEALAPCARQEHIVRSRIRSTPTQVAEQEAEQEEGPGLGDRLVNFFRRLTGADREEGESSSEQNGAGTTASPDRSGAGRKPEPPRRQEQKSDSSVWENPFLSNE